MTGVRALVVALVALGAIAAAVGGWEEALRHVDAGTPVARAVALTAATVAGLSWAAIGAALAWTRPGNALGWLMLGVGVLTQVGLAEESLADGGPWPERPSGLVISLVAGFALYVLIGLLPALYPTGRLPSRAWQGPSALVVAGALALQAQWLIEQDGGAAAWPIVAIPYAAGLAAIWTMSAVRLARAPRPERQQLAWLFVSVVALMGTQSLSLIPSLDEDLTLWAQLLGLYLLPVAIGVGIMRYQLLGIETPLRRALVYSLLTIAIVAVHALASVLAGASLTRAAVPSVITAVVVALGLFPLRRALQRAVDRFFYGARTNPLRAVSELGDRLAAAPETELPEIVIASVRDAVRSSGVGIRHVNGALRAGADVAPSFTADLTVGGTTVGRLEVAARDSGERYSARDIELLRALAPQVAVALRSLDLAEELERKRDAVIRATTHERDRLRNDLHDELGPSLSGVGLGLQALEDALEDGDIHGTRRISAVLRDEMARAVTEVRRILADLGPAALVDDGLGAALRRRVVAAARPLPLSLQIGELPDLSADVEEAVYRIVGEAVTNAVRHSGASSLEVEVGMIEGGIALRVADDGRGFAASSIPGVGLVSMRERAAAVGGLLSVDSGESGTTVTFSVPVAVSA
jgi:signal transduction histidine kinase